jgi:hypothetical protein
MANVNGETGRREVVPGKGNADKVRKVIDDLCGLAGASVAIEEQFDGGGNQPAGRQRLQVTYTGERPMPFGQWFKLIDSIDAALDPTGLIDWELSELSEENEQERTAAWAIVPAAVD